MGIIATEDLARTTGVSRNPNYVENLCVTSSRAKLFGCGISNSYSNNLLVQASDLYYTNLAYEIDPSKCIACGACVRYCQESAISDDGNNGAYYINKRYCVGCGMCQSLCPVSAINGPVSRTGGPNYPPNPPNPPNPPVDPIISNPALLIYPSAGGSYYTFSSVTIMVNTPSGAQRFTPNLDIRVIIGPPDDCTTTYYEICRLSSGTAYDVTYDNYGLGYLINENSVTFRLPFLPYNGNYEVYYSTVFPNGQEDLEIIGTTESGASVYTDLGYLWRCDYVYYNGRCDTIVSCAEYSSDADGNGSIAIWL